MSWTRAYRLSLHLLPAALRARHGAAMESLFTRELERARVEGPLRAAFVGAAGIWDVLRRGAYEQIRPPRDTRLGSRDMPTTRELLRRHAGSFAITFVTLTTLLLANVVSQQLPELRANGASAGAIGEAVLLSVPFTAALTIPMSVFVAVLWQFTRLGADETLAAARLIRHGVRRLAVPVLGAAAGVAAIAFVVTAEIVPRANERLVSVLTQRAAAPTDRTMTIGELRAAMRTVGPATESAAVARLVSYEIEVQKKLALPAACVFLALAAIAIALTIPRGGAALVIGASLTVFATYYVALIAGDALAYRLVVPPFVAMWAANALLLAVALLAAWTRRAPRASDGGGTVVLGA
jgi:lipopolysaccharide export LptBFGC system permease protein LptF